MHMCIASFTNCVPLYLTALYFLYTHVFVHVSLFYYKYSNIIILCSVIIVAGDLVITHSRVYYLYCFIYP